MRIWRNFMGTSLFVKRNIFMSLFWATLWLRFINVKWNEANNWQTLDHSFISNDDNSPITNLFYVEVISRQFTSELFKLRLTYTSRKFTYFYSSLWYWQIDFSPNTYLHDAIHCEVDLYIHAWPFIVRIIHTWPIKHWYFINGQIDMDAENYTTNKLVFLNASWIRGKQNIKQIVGGAGTFI